MKKFRKHVLNTFNRSHKWFKFSIYDITLAATFLALFLIVDFISEVTITGRWAFSFKIGFFILFGIILGPLKGVFLAFIADTFSLLMLGRIYFWMIQFAIVPPLIALVSWAFFTIYLSNWKFKFFIPHIILIATIIIFYSFFIVFLNDPKLINRVVRREEITAFAVYIIATVFFAVAIIAMFTLFLIYEKTKKPIFISTIFILSIVIFIMVLSRWLWGPISYIAYYNRFISPGTKSKNIRGIEAFYIFYLIPAIIKSMISIPVYTFLLAVILPTIFKLNKDYKIMQKFKY